MPESRPPPKVTSPDTKVSHRDMPKLMWIVPLAFFFLNPAVACGPAEPQFQYGASEMRAAVEGDRGRSDL